MLKRRSFRACPAAAILAAAILVVACDSAGDNGDSGAFPHTPAEIQASVQAKSTFAVDGWGRVDQMINEAIAASVFFDPAVAAEDLENLDGVTSAAATPTGSGIVVAHEDGTYSNVIVTREEDERIFGSASGKAGAPSVSFDPIPFSLHGSGIGEFPTGGGRALILAPFQGDFDKDIEQLRRLLEAARFTVDVFENAEANLERFRSSFLSEYDAVIIDTHGAAGFRTQDGTMSTMLVTGETLSLEREQALSLEERRVLGVIVNYKAPYYAVSAPWLKATAGTDFPTSWIFAAAGESSRNVSSSQSLSEAFLDLGAGGFSGFEGNMNRLLLDLAAERLLAHFSSGSSLSEASILTRTDFGLSARTWTVRVAGADAEASVEGLRDRQRISEPFYLFDPEEIVGYAEIVPSYGPPGTEIFYEVGIREPFAANVTAVRFIIDSTDEVLGMTRVNETIWRAVGLFAPPATVYPRVDTFTFTAVGPDGTIGHGSSAFTITAPTTSKRVNPRAGYAGE